MDNKNLILAFALSMLVLIGWNMMFPPQQPLQPVSQAQVSPPTDAEHDTAAQDLIEKTADTTTRPQADHTPASTAPASQKEVLSMDTVAEFGNDVLALKINARGWLTEATLLQYQESLDNPEKIKLLSHSDIHATYINSGVLRQKLVEPFKLVSLTKQDGKTTAIFEGKLGDGYIWQRTYTLDPGSYVIKTTDRIQGGAGLKLYTQVVEKNPIAPKTRNYNEHNGPIGLFNDELTEVTYEELDETGTKKFASVGGWTGMMTRYFMKALFGADQDASYRYYFKGDARAYQSGMINDGFVDNGDMVFENNIFIGPKSIPYLKQFDIGLERAVDFGWFTVIAKPLHEIMLWLYQYIPNYGLIIILMVVALKAILFVPTQSGYRSMANMRKLQPKLTKLKELYGDDRQKMGQEVMALYKKHKVNPLGGCLPILLQMPVFFALYKVLLISIELRQAPFYGWIQDLSAQDPYFILPILMGVSMFIQMQLNPAPTDPIQAKVMKFLPLFMTAMFLFFPAGLVLYWVVNNILSIIQQRLVMKSMNVD